MKKSIIFLLLLSLPICQAHAGLFDWVTDHYKALFAATAVTGVAARATWAKYKQLKIIKESREIAERLQPFSEIAIAENKGGRETMEDTHHPKGRHSDNRVAGVFDGHGGSAVAMRVADLLPRNLLYPAFPSFWNIFWRGALHPSVKTYIEQAFLNTNKAILKDSSINEQGSTAVCAIKHDNNLYVAHVGDAGALLVSRDSCRKLTVDHNFSDPKELERAQKIGARIKISQNLRAKSKLERDVIEDGKQKIKHIEVTRSFGDRGYIPGMIAEPDIAQIPINPTDEDEYVVLASDGIWESLSSEDVAHIVRANYGKPLDFIAKELISQASVAAIHRGIANAEGRGIETSLYTPNIGREKLDQWRQLRDTDSSGFIKEACKQANDNQTVALLKLK